MLEKIPYLIGVGERDMAAGTVAVTHRVEGDQGAFTVEELAKRLDREVREKVLPPVAAMAAVVNDRGAKFSE